jgi:Tfp pilus assembly protein PilF
MDFSTCKDEVSDERERMIDIEKKLPMLNNIALCLQKQSRVDAALGMLDRVLALDKDNTKALCRKLTILMQQNLTE